MKNKRNYDLSTKINKVFKEKEDLYLLTHLLEILNIYDKKVVLFKEIDETDKYIASSLIKEIFNLNMFKSILKDENKEVDDKHAIIIKIFHNYCYAIRELSPEDWGLHLSNLYGFKIVCDFINSTYEQFFDEGDLSKDNISKYLEHVNKNEFIELVSSEEDESENISKLLTI